MQTIPVVYTNVGDLVGGLIASYAKSGRN